MIKIKNNIIPFKGYAAITLWPFLFYREISPQIERHEEIHAKQQKELLIIPFYIIYLLEAIFNGYDSISFEKEAYAHQDDLNYKRRLFAMWRK